MAVWAFACKLESSMNRWFDGTDQDISFNDGLVAELEKNTGDITSVLEEQRKTLLKYVSQTRIGIGSMMFNEVMFNQFFSKISDFEDAVLMQDDIEIDLSRAIVRISDILYPVEYFNKEITGNKSEEIIASDDTFISNIDGNDQDGFALDDAMVSDVSLVQMTRIIQPDITDSVLMTETFKASIGGKSIADVISMKDSSTKEIDNIVGDESYAGLIGSFMFNELVLNGTGEEATITTVIGLTEEVQIILT